MTMWCEKWILRFKEGGFMYKGGRVIVKRWKWGAMILLCLLFAERFCGMGERKGNGFC